jgi:hypothetical protein
MHITVKFLQEQITALQKHDHDRDIQAIILMLITIVTMVIIILQVTRLEESKEYIDRQIEKIRLEHQKLFRDIAIAKLRTMDNQRSMN